MTDLITRLREAERCKILDCESPVRHNGLCLMHYTRVRRHGNPHTTKRTPPKVIRQWMQRQLKAETDDCVLWPFATSTDGYGRIRHNGRQQNAHRIMLQMHDPEREFDGALALHTCGKGHEGCVNVRHLYWGTPQQNADDRMEHGNAPQGSACHAAKLTESDIIPIFEARAAGREPSQIAESFGVTRGTINMVLKRKTWRHVEVPAALLQAQGAQDD
jgi:hypothetical protein